jgi:hypothetical protein
MRWIARTAPVVLLAACGGSADVRFVVTTEAEARATEVELRVGDETRFFERVKHGAEIVERSVPEGTLVELRARNGGDEGAVSIEAWQDGCSRGAQRCEGTGCVTFVELLVEACD